MRFILYIGENRNDLSIYGFNHFMIKNISHSKNAHSAYNYLISSDVLPQIVFLQNDNHSNLFSFIKKIRSIPRFNKIVFVLLSENMTKKEIKYAFHIGFDEVVKSSHKIYRYIKRLKFLVEYKTKQKQKRKIKVNYIKVNFFKRLFDVLLAIIALILLSPVFLITIIALKIESKGPVFYASKRVGSGYDIFDFYKFRSMYVNADKQIEHLKGLNQYANKNILDDNLTCPDCKKGKVCSPILIIDQKEICEKNHIRIKKLNGNSTFLKVKNDPRVTKIGKFIRNTSIDELPQLFNVLKGDMSIVGNRPIPLYEAELLTSDNWSKRFLAPAGITGLWQVEKRGGGEMSEEERKNLDNKYAQNSSFLYDIKLILRTIPALLQSENV